MDKKTAASPEFSRLVRLEGLGADEFHEVISATPEERVALARRFGLLSLDQLEATVKLEPSETEGLLRLSGHLTAQVTQACVVTLDPVRSHIEEDFALQVTLGGGADARLSKVIEVEVEEQDPPELAGPNGLDVGEIVAQQLAMALDPYPRAPGAQLPRSTQDQADLPASSENPFAVLADLKRDP